jgi:hypothetical protein
MADSPTANSDFIRPTRIAFLVIFCLAFAIRAFLLTKIPERYILPHNRWEIPAIVMSLYETGEFANPYLIPSGPTGHAPPLYPAWVSLLYRIFGISLRAGYIQWLFDIAFDSTVFAMLPWLAARFGLGWPAGCLGGLAAALLPRWYISVESLAAIALGLILVTFADRWTRADASLARSFLLGIASGIAFHIKPALLPVVLGCLAFEVWWIPRRRGWRSAAMIAAGIAIAITPWTWRNWVTFHELYFIRSNFGLEMQVGNHDHAHADVEMTDERYLRHPRINVAEAVRVRDLGEAEYMRRAKAETLRWITEHPSQYAKLVALRILYFWIGPIYHRFAGTVFLALFVLAVFGAVKRLPPLSVPHRAALIIPLLTFPLVYYLVIWRPDYRIPIEWILILFAGSGVTWLFGRWRSASVAD